MVAFKMTVVILLFGILLLQITEGNPEMSSETKTQIKKGFSEVKNVVDAVQNLASNEAQIANIQKLSQCLGVLGGFMSFALSFIPKEDSAELKYMKREFAEVNMKLDRITRELDSVKDMITLENQRAAYIKDTRKIIFGYKQLTKNYITEITAIKSCSTAEDCLRRRLGVSERYLKAFDVKTSLFTILTGTMESTSTFGDPVLDLIKLIYKCDINKVVKFANGVIILAFRGQQVVLAHEKLTGTNTSISLAMKDWTMMVYKLEKKVDDIKAYCYNNIKTFMKADVQDTKYQTNMPSNKDAADKMKANLEKKYPWLYWTVISYGARGSKKHWGVTLFENMPSSKDSRKRVIRVIVQDKGTYQNQRQELSNALDNIVKDRFSRRDVRDAKRIYDIFKKRLQKTTVWRKLKAFVVLKDYSDLQIAVDDQHHLYHYNKVLMLDLGYRLRRKSIIRYKRIRIWASLKSEEETAGVTCKRSCNKKGRCAILPHSSSTYCVCNPYFQGDNCQEYDNINLATSVDSMLAVTATIPKLTDIYFELLDMQDFIGASLGRVQDSVAALDSKLQDKLNNLNAKLTNEFQLANLITQYSSSLGNLKYYLHLFQNLNSSQPRYKEKRQALASDILRPANVQKWVFELHYLLVGRNDVSLLAHKPLLFILMDKHKEIACSSKYKEALDNSWRQLIVLQNQAYVVWAQARSIMNLPSDDIAAKYKMKTAEQESFMKTSTCEISVPRSSNLNCTGGFYLYQTLSVINKCEPNSYMTGINITSCEKKSSSCNACNCNMAGSSSAQCNDSGQCSCRNNYFGKTCHDDCNCNNEGSSSAECNVLSGQCSCINNYFGRTCHDRNCTWTKFGSYGACSTSCGYGVKIKSRNITYTQKGKGENCIGDSQNSTECMQHCCNGTFYCMSNTKCISDNLTCNYDNDCENPEDELDCREICQDKYTPWKFHGWGNAVYMARHRINCGAPGNVIKMFKMETKLFKIRFKYTCCNLLKFRLKRICSHRKFTNGYTNDGFGDTVYLDRQPIECGSTGLLNDYWLSRNSNEDRWRYNYICCDMDEKYRARLSCYTSSTSFTKDGNGNCKYLDSQKVSCNYRHFLQYFRLNRNSGHNKWRYTYRCCSITTR